MQRVEFVPHYRCYSERCIGNRAGLHAKIAEPPPILCKDTNKPRAKANLFAFCRGEVSKKKSKIRKGGSNRAGLYARIAEPLPIFCKDNMQRHLPTTPGAGFIEL